LLTFCDYNFEHYAGAKRIANWHLLPLGQAIVDCTIACQCAQDVFFLLELVVILSLYRNCVC